MHIKGEDSPYFSFTSHFSSQKENKMKREGRPHGMVRTHPVTPSPWNPNPETRHNMFDSPTTAGLFTKVPSKPTNHSKFTGKCARPRCNECHANPAGKSKDKAKGTRKTRSHNEMPGHGLVTWRVVDTKPGLKFSGFSASGMLDHLDDDDHYEYFEDNNVVDHQVYERGLVCDDLMTKSEIVIGAVEIKEASDDDVYDNIDDKSFCDLGVFWEQVNEDEGWGLMGKL